MNVVTTHCETMTYAEYARHRGVSRPVVHAWKRKKRLVMRNGRVDVAASDAALDEGATGQPSADKHLSKPEAEKVKENYLARLRKLEYEQKSGSLVLASDVEREVFELWRAERDAWLNWPSRIAPMMAAKFGIDGNALLIELETCVRRHLSERTS